MATRYWQGQSDAVAQMSQAGVTGYDAATTYSVLVGGETIASVIAEGSAAATASGLATAWNAVTGPYAATITAAGNGAVFEAVADVPGNPFAFTVAAAGGSGAWSSVTTPTANAGPNDWDTAENWSAATVPVDADDVIFRDSAVDVRWGLDQSAVDLASLSIEQTYSGKIGLDRTAVVTGGDGSTNSEKPEYRDHYLDIGWDTCKIGEVLGSGSPAGSGRLKLSNDKAGASSTEVFDTGSSSSDGSLPAVRLLAANAAADIQVRKAPAGVGIAVDQPTETSTVGNIAITDETPAARVFIGTGTTVGGLVQQGGVNILRAAATVPSIEVLGGELSIEGSGYTVTALTIDGGGTVYANSTPTGGNAVTTINVRDGTVDGSQSRLARTWGTVNLISPGGTLIADSDVVTITTLAEPSGPYQIAIG